jgi:hypothetical protein
MKKNSKLSLAIVGLAVLIAIFTLVLPSLYIEGNSRIIMGFLSSFGGTLKNYNGYDLKIHLSAGGFINFLIPLLIALLTYLVGKSQRSTYFITFCLFITNIVLTLSTKIFFMNVNIGGAIQGIHSCVLSVGPYVCVVLQSIGAIASLVGLLYKPNSRFTKKY